MQVHLEVGAKTPKEVTGETVTKIGEAIYKEVTRKYASVRSLPVVCHIGKKDKKKSYLVNCLVSVGGFGSVKIFSVTAATQKQAEAKNDEDPLKSCVVSI